MKIPRMIKLLWWMERCLREVRLSIVMARRDGRDLEIYTEQKAILHRWGYRERHGLPSIYEDA